MLSFDFDNLIKAYLKSPTSDDLGKKELIKVVCILLYNKCLVYIQNAYETDELLASTIEKYLDGFVNILPTFDDFGGRNLVSMFFIVGQKRAEVDLHTSTQQLL